MFGHYSGNPKKAFIIGGSFFCFILSHKTAK